MYYHIWLQPKHQSYMMVADLVLNLGYEDLDRRFLVPYAKGEPLVNKGKTVTKDNIGHLRIYVSSEYLGRAQYKPHRLFEVADEITDELITGPPGWALEDSHLAQELRLSANAQDVFVVHGRNQAARDALFSFLRPIGLHPVEWSEAVRSTGKASPYIGEILDAAFLRTQAVVVLFTPDDEARLQESFRTANDPPDETQLTGQARPNVLFEAGMAMGRNPDRTVLVELGDLRPFSDVAGRHVVRLNDSSQRRQDVALRLRSAGCPVNLDGTDWHTAGKFETAVAPLIQESTGPADAVEWQSTTVESLQLSKEAQGLLREATRGNGTTGMILMTASFSGLTIQINGLKFSRAGDSRSEARWKQALIDLLEHGLVEDLTGNRTSFAVTHKGYETADALASS